jgi:DNA-binding CsgD family transcriptional regulator
MSSKPLPLEGVSKAWTVVAEFRDGPARYVLLRLNDAVEGLTVRERQVLARAAIGQTNKVIAYELGLSDSTVRVHMARACAKLGVETRDAAIEAFRIRNRGSPHITP